jgi:MOSC domain-containing protein YiiM
VATRPRLVSVQTGRPRTVAAADPWITSIFKTPVEGRVRLRPMNLDGDEQADLTVHGGVDKAICVYSADHYAAWQHELDLPAFGPGAFGENFTVTGLSEGDVSIGDRWTVGDAVVEVSQPRSPCWKIGRRWERLDLPKRVIESRRTGWYLRVVGEGAVEAGQAIVVASRPHPRWTISRVNDLAYAPADEVDAGEIASLAAADRLSRSWREWLAKRLATIERRHTR